MLAAGIIQGPEARIDDKPLLSGQGPEDIPTACRDRSRRYPEASKFNPEKKLGFSGSDRNHGV
jgi:hypothetical protein